MALPHLLICITKQISPLPLTVRLTFGFIIISLSLIGQEGPTTLLPVQSEQKWGFIDEAGQIIIPPQYDAVAQVEGDHATFLKDGFMGVVNKSGTEVISPQYRLLSQLGQNTFSYQNQGFWGVSNFQGDSLFPPIFEEVTALGQDFLLVRQNGICGAVTFDGREIIPMEYEALSMVGERIFKAVRNKQTLLLDTNAKMLTGNIAGEITMVNGHCFYKQNGYWGASTKKGLPILEAIWDDFKRVNKDLIQVGSGSKWALYSLRTRRFLCDPIYDDFRVVQMNQIIFENGGKFGILDYNGSEIIGANFDEIIAGGGSKYLVRLDNKWGIAKIPEGLVLAPRYDYIFPFRGRWTQVINGEFTGVINFSGTEVIPLKFRHLTVHGRNIKAYSTGGQVRIFEFDANGNFTETASYNKVRTIKVGNSPSPKLHEKTNQNEQEVPKYAWFYESKARLWGLRELATGKIKIQPTYPKIHVKSNGFTITEVRSESQRNPGTNKSYFGLVDQQKGKQLFPTQMSKIYISDFDGENIRLARCIDKDGYFRLFDRSGKFLRMKYAYLGPFHKGIARFNFGGKRAKKRGIEQERICDFVAFKRSIESLDTLEEIPYNNQRWQLHCKGGKWGLLDLDGAVLLGAKFDFLESPRHKNFIAKGNNSWGVVSINGDTIVPFAFHRVTYLEGSDFRLYHLVQKKRAVGLLDPLGEFKIAVSHGGFGNPTVALIKAKKNGKWGFVNAHGKEMIPFQYQDAGDFSQGLAAVRQKRKWYYIDASGKRKIDQPMHEAGPFQSGIAWTRQGGRYTYINLQGKRIFKQHFSVAENFQNGRAIVKEGLTYGLIDTNGKWVLPARFRQLQYLSENELYLGLRKGRYCWFHPDGKKLSSAKFTFLSPFEDNYCSAVSKKKTGILNKEGQFVRTKNTPELFSINGGLIRFKRHGKFGFIDTLGLLVIPAKYSKAKDFNNGLAAVRVHGRWGAIDANGHLQVPPRFLTLSRFSEDMAVATDTSGTHFFINKRGMMLFGQRFEDARPFSQGVAQVKLNEKWGLINTNGIWTLSPAYDALKMVAPDWIEAEIKEVSGIAREDGSILAPVEYFHIQTVGKGIFRLENDQKLGYLAYTGKWIWEPKR